MAMRKQESPYSRVAVRILRHIRIARKCSVTDMAKVLGIKYEAYGMIEGYVTSLSFDRMIKMCDKLEISPNRLVKEIEIVVEEEALTDEGLVEICKGLMTKRVTKCQTH